MEDANQEPSIPELAPPSPSPPLDLRFWLLVVGIGGVGGLLLGQGELAALVALSGLFAASHAADLEPAHRMLYRAVAWVVPAGGLAMFAGLGFLIRQSDLTGTTRSLGLAFASIGIALSVATAFSPFAASLAQRLFRVPEPSSSLRLAGRIALVAALLYPPAAIAFPALLEGLNGASLVGRDSLWSNLVGMAVLSFGAVGFRIRRDLPETLRRLGLEMLETRHWIVIALGLVALVVLNAGAEWVQQRWFHDLWASDQRVNQLIAGGLSKWDTLLLGLSAGIGEELSLRGALQPKLGVFLTSLLFALLHVQYSWFGIGIILLLGLLLGTIRQRTNTTAAIVLHALYDTFAVFTVPTS
jgi:CAAX prenyl protease-like protein